MPVVAQPLAATSLNYLDCSKNNGHYILIIILTEHWR
jgi:hypothetical protein